MIAKILIVEDNLVVARGIEQSIKSLGYAVIGNVTSCEDALKIMEQYSVDLILMDINIEGKRNGIETARLINTNHPTPVVFLTALSDLSTLDKVKSAEPYGYIVKPFEDTDLSSAVELALYKFAKDQESKKQQLKLTEGFSIMEQAFFIINEDYTLNFINQTAIQLSGMCPKKSAGKIHINNVIGFCTSKKEKISINYFLNNDGDISGEETLCYFPYSQEAHTLPVRTQRVLEHNHLVGWIMTLSLQEPCPSSDLNKKPIEFNTSSTQPSSCIFVRKGNKHVRVDIDTIAYLEAMDNFVIVHTVTEQFVVYSTLKELEEKLPVKEFLRIHRSYLIRLDRVTYLEENFLTIQKKVLPISRNYKKLFKSKVLFI